MIPKVIHYCWFGHKPMPDFLNEYIKSGHEHCPGYKIIKWDESNFDVNCSNFTKQAYKANHHAFIADYARLWILYNYGGIYLDTDMMLLRPIDSLLENKAFIMNFIRDDFVMIRTSFIGAEAKNSMIKYWLDEYDKMDFEVSFGVLNITASNDFFTRFCKKCGGEHKDCLQNVNNCIFYPSEYCYSYDEFLYKKLTDHTYAYHKSTSLCYNTGEMKTNRRLGKYIDLKKNYKKFFDSKFCNLKINKRIIDALSNVYIYGVIHSVDEKYLTKRLIKKKYDEIYDD